MGYLDAFPTSSTPPLPPFSSAAAAGGSYTPPSRTTRDRCWAARDAFFACLDARGVVDAVKSPDGVRLAAEHCGGEDRALGRECASSWVKYFKERRIMEHKKSNMLKGLEAEGAKQLDGTLPGKGGPPVS